jgi:hypothetical protein
MNLTYDWYGTINAGLDFGRFGLAKDCPNPNGTINVKLN